MIMLTRRSQKRWRWKLKSLKKRLLPKRKPKFTYDSVASHLFVAHYRVTPCCIVTCVEPWWLSYSHLHVSHHAASSMVLFIIKLPMLMISFIIMIPMLISSCIIMLPMLISSCCLLCYPWSHTSCCLPSEIDAPVVSAVPDNFGFSGNSGFFDSSNSSVNSSFSGFSGIFGFSSSFGFFGSFSFSINSRFSGFFGSSSFSSVSGFFGSSNSSSFSSYFGYSEFSSFFGFSGFSDFSDFSLGSLLLLKPKDK